MRRVIATLPESMPELCLIRLGIQVRSVRAVFYAIRLARAIDRSAAEAIVAGAGLLHSERFSLGRKHFGVWQYWRSFEDLEAWSHRPPHSEWWRQAVERMRTKGDLGIYHETFLVPRDRIESIYLDCAPAGLAVFGTTGEPVGSMTASRGRLGRG
ncbi:phenylacetaldoxime dehydratase family protein [Singulisphaera acidiphila]|uniref:phenylacetaldoxime dehydratase family protein n=1 Tax=Singulisphaera acidiphila TaxID=466153 RepID=UPI0002E03767|nr:phenylacetaldoxime dehydratase family protein [Singulisphaera acidiphila]